MMIGSYGHFGIAYQLHLQGNYQSSLCNILEEQRPQAVVFMTCILEELSSNVGPYILLTPPRKH